MEENSAENKVSLPAVIETKPKSLVEVGEQINYIESFIRKFLKEGIDYGTIPGTQKPSLWKPGSEKLGAAFSLTANYTTVDSVDEPFKEWKYPITRYDKKSGEEIKETKYTRGYYWRRVRCELINRQTGICWATQEAECGSTERGREVAPSNTILKMAQKRAYVGAMLNATFTSDRFTADVEDYKKAEKTESGDIPPPPAKMESRYGSDDKPTKCQICGKYHIIKGDMIYRHPTLKTDKGKPTWGKPECYAATFKKADKSPQSDESEKGDSAPTEGRDSSSGAAAGTENGKSDPTRDQLLKEIPNLERECATLYEDFKPLEARDALVGTRDLTEGNTNKLVGYRHTLTEKIKEANA